MVQEQRSFPMWMFWVTVSFAAAIFTTTALELAITIASHASAEALNTERKERIRGDESCRQCVSDLAALVNDHIVKDQELSGEIRAWMKMHEQRGGGR